MSHFCAACVSDDQDHPWRECTCLCGQCHDKAVAREVENIKYKASEDYATWVDERHAATIKAEQESSKRNGDVLDQTVQYLFHKIVNWEGLMADLAQRVGVLEEEVGTLIGAPAGQTASVNDLRNAAGTPVQVRCPDGRTPDVGDLIEAEQEYAALPLGSVVVQGAEDEPQTIWTKVFGEMYGRNDHDPDHPELRSPAIMAGVPRRLTRIGYPPAAPTASEPSDTIQPGDRTFRVGDLIQTAAEYAAMPSGSIVVNLTGFEPQTPWIKCFTGIHEWCQDGSDHVLSRSNEMLSGGQSRILHIGYDSAERTIPEPSASIQPGDLVRTAAEFAALPTDSIVAPDSQPPVWKDGDFWEPVGVGSRGMAADNPGGCVVLRIGSGWREKGKQNEAIPEPPVGSVVLDKDGVVWQRRDEDAECWWKSVEADSWHTWEELWADPDYAPLTLIHEGATNE